MTALALVAALALQADAPPRPWLIASIHVVPFSAFPDVLGAGATLHAIPFVDLEGGVGGFPAGVSWWVRGGPRYLLMDARDEQHLGATLRVSARFGFKQLKTPLVPDTQGFNFAGCLDFSYFLKPHLALGAHLSGGGVYETRADAPDALKRRRAIPELRLAFTVTF